MLIHYIWFVISRGTSFSAFSHSSWLRSATALLCDFFLLTITRSFSSDTCTDLASSIAAPLEYVSSGDPDVFLDSVFPSSAYARL
jgi:hypothetical protein